MNYSKEVEEMCIVAKGPKHGPAPIPEEGKWVQAKEVKDISGYTHGVGWCAPQRKSAARIPQKAILLIFFIIAFFHAFRKGQNTHFAKKAHNIRKKERRSAPFVSYFGLKLLPKRVGICAVLHHLGKRRHHDGLIGLIRHAEPFIRRF